MVHRYRARVLKLVLNIDKEKNFGCFLERQNIKRRKHQDSRALLYIYFNEIQRKFQYPVVVAKDKFIYKFRLLQDEPTNEICG